MSSSTSAFRQAPRQGWKVLVVVALAVAAVELCTRALGQRLSVDARHIASIPSIARDLAAGARPRVLFLGNSLTRVSVDLSVWEAELRRSGVTAGSSAKVMPDATAVVEWYYVFRNRFVDAAAAPDVVIVSIASNRHLADRQVEAARLGALYCDLGDIPELFSFDLRTVDERIGFFVGRVFSCVGIRERLQARVGDRLVPNFRPVTAELNPRWRRSEQAPGGGRIERRASYQTLRRFLRLCRRAGTAAVVVVVPLPQRQIIDPSIAEVVRSEGMVFLDARDLPGLQPDDFPDGYHVGARGAAAYTAWLARQVSALLVSPTGS